MRHPALTTKASYAVEVQRNFAELHLHRFLLLKFRWKVALLLCDWRGHFLVK